MSTITTLMRIGELAERCGVNPKIIRYYEQIGLLPELVRLASGYRVYGQTDVDWLSFIRAAQRFGLGLDEIREVFDYRERGEQLCVYVLAEVRRQAVEIDRRISELLEMREEMSRLLVCADELVADACYCYLIEGGSV